jgi:hypothetical protein
MGIVGVVREPHDIVMIRKEITHVEILLRMWKPDSTIGKRTYSLERRGASTKNYLRTVCEDWQAVDRFKTAYATGRELRILENGLA